MEDRAATDQQTTNPQEPDDTTYGLLSVMVAALKENPITEGLAEEQLFAISEEALQAGTINDKEWLESKVALLKSEAAHGKMPEIFISEHHLVQGEAELADILADHAKWVKSVLDPGAAIKEGRANLKGSDLSGFNLEGADLRGAILEETTCVGTNFAGANLATTVFTNANLAGANLEGAKLRRALLHHTNLEGANLRGADLRGAEFPYANLRDAVLDGVLGEAPTQRAVTPPPPPAGEEEPSDLTDCLQGSSEEKTAGEES